MRHKILVVDDEPGIPELLGRFLDPEGFDVSIARTAKEGLGLMEREIFNLVLLDIRLPDGDGKELIGEFKNFNPLVQIMMITAYTSMDNVVACIENGAVDYFAKPFRDIDVVVHGVRAAANRIERWRRSISMASL